MRDHVIAVDVGTGSARAGVVDRNGILLARSEHPIDMHVEAENIAEQSSEQIWAAVCIAVKGAIQATGLSAERIAGLGFDATCSLVLRNAVGAPLTLTAQHGQNFDTIVWLDHRAVTEAEECTRTGHAVIQHSGGTLSPEMQIPKLLWLKRQRPDLWARLGSAFDLADFLTWRATGSNARSLSTLTSKWGYLQGTRNPWPADFLQTIGLPDLRARAALPEAGIPVGRSIGMLGAEAAQDLGLDAGIPVGAGMVDAYAGALGVLGCHAAEGAEALAGRYALIGGTSSCVVSFAPKPVFRHSVWGPYNEAVFAGSWLTEAGQSATGALLNHILRMHAAGGEPTVSRHRAVIERVKLLRAEEGPGFAEEINLLPDFHGNRSPFADPKLTGMITGMTLDQSFDGLCRIYWRACVAIALGLRQVLETMHAGETGPVRLHLTGGHVKNALLNELYGDVAGCEVAIPQTDDAVLVGTAMNAATASGLYATLADAGRAMAPATINRAPDLAARKDQYDRDYRRFLAMQELRGRLAEI